MQVEIVRHDGGAEYPHGDVEHRRVAEDFARRNESAQDSAERRLGQKYLEEKAGADRGDERDDKRFEQAESFVLEIENYQNVQRRDDDSDGDWNVEQQVEGDRRSDDLGKVAGGDGDLAPDPK